MEIFYLFLAPSNTFCSGLNLNMKVKLKVISPFLQYVVILDCVVAHAGASRTRSNIYLPALKMPFDGSTVGFKTEPNRC